MFITGNLSFMSIILISKSSLKIVPTAKKETKLVNVPHTETLV